MYTIPRTPVKKISVKLLTYSYRMNISSTYSTSSHLGIVRAHHLFGKAALPPFLAPASISHPVPTRYVEFSKLPSLSHPLGYLDIPFQVVTALDTMAKRVPVVFRGLFSYAPHLSKEQHQSRKRSHNSGK